MAGAVDGELPVVCGADVAQSAQFEGGVVSQRRVDVAEDPAVADLQAGDLRPAFPGPGAQPLLQGRLGGIRISGHDSDSSPGGPRRRGVPGTGAGTA